MVPVCFRIDMIVVLVRERMYAQRACVLITKVRATYVDVMSERAGSTGAKIAVGGEVSEGMVVYVASLFGRSTNASSASRMKESRVVVET